jgi:CubicO group peptidase (beta-lactamase class C family)
MPARNLHARRHRLRAGLTALVIILVSAHAGAEPDLCTMIDDAADLEPLRALVVARNGYIVAERGYRGYTPDTPTNIKSASKAIVSALVGIAIEKGLLEGVDQPIAPLLRDAMPAGADPRLAEVTVGHLLSMQAGLARTSGNSYGRWIASDDWVRAALAQPFVDEPGGTMLYSTGSTHLLSAILSRTSGRSTLALARDWLGGVGGFRISHWQRDPQGIYFGGNQMAMSTRSLLAFGELYRRGGINQDGRRIVPAEWIQHAWQPRTQSRFTGDDYGFGWFLRCMGGYPAAYAWGYGGQMLYVVPEAALTIAMTSDDAGPAGRTGYRDELHRLTTAIIAAATAGNLGAEAGTDSAIVGLRGARRCRSPVSFERSPSGSSVPAGRPGCDLPHTW